MYESIENFSPTYLQPKVKKDSLLKPKVYVSGGTGGPLQLPNVQSSTSRTFYSCFYGHSYVSDELGAMCCKSMANTLKYLDPLIPKQASSSNEGGYVKGAVIYMVMDDLEVKPLSTIISISTMLNKFNVMEIGALEEKVVEVGMHE